MVSLLKKWGYFDNESVFCYKVLPFFIVHQDLSFGDFALKIEFVAFVYIYENIIPSLWTICNQV